MEVQPSGLRKLMPRSHPRCQTETIQRKKISQMRITRVEVFKANLPLKRPFRIALVSRLVVE